MGPSYFCFLHGLPKLFVLNARGIASSSHTKQIQVTFWKRACKELLAIQRMENDFYANTCQLADINLCMPKNPLKQQLVTTLINEIS